jgi:hypothetical protein
LPVCGFKMVDFQNPRGGPFGALNVIRPMARPEVGDGSVRHMRENLDYRDLRATLVRLG